MANNRLEITLAAKVDEFRREMKASQQDLKDLAGQANKSAKDTSAALEKLSVAELADRLTAVASKIGEMGRQFTDAAAQADDLADSLKGAFGEAADSVANLSQELGTGFGVFSPEEVGEAAKAMQNLGNYSEEALRRIVNAAAGSDKSVSGLAEAFSKFDKFANAETLKPLREQIGASDEDLHKFGATVDETGKVLLETEAQIQAAKDALAKFTDSKYGNALEQMADPLAKAKGEFTLFQQEVGKSVIELEESFGPALLSATEYLRGLPEGMKAFIGVGSQAVGTLGNFAGGAIQLGANLKLMGVTMTGVQSAASAAMTAVLGLSGAALGLIAVLGAAAVGLALYTAELQAANKASEELLKTEEQRAQWLKSNKDIYGKSADEIRKMGKTSADVAHEILALQDQLEEARKRGDAAATQRYQTEIARLQGVKKELTVTETAKREEAGKTEKSQKQAAADKKKAEEDAKKAAEEARKEGITADLHAIEVGAAAHTLSKQQQIAGLEAVLTKHKLTADERRSIETKIAGLQGQLADEAARKVEEAERKKREAAEKTEAERKKAAEKARADREKAAAEAQKAAEKEAADLQRLEQENVELRRAGVEERIADLERQADAGKNVEAELVRALKERLELEAQAIQERAEADKAATDSAKVREGIEVNAQLKIAAAARATEKAIKEAHQRQKKEAEDTNSELDKTLQKLKDIKAEADKLNQEQKDATNSPIVDLGEDERRRQRLADLRDQEISEKRKKAALEKEEGIKQRIKDKAAELEGKVPGETGAGASGGGAPVDANAISAAVERGVAAALKANPQKLDVTVNAKGAEVDSTQLNYSKTRMPGQR